LWFADPTSYHDLFFLQNLLHTTKLFLGRRPALPPVGRLLLPG
jgi:hypothetical protein